MPVRYRTSTTIVSIPNRTAHPAKESQGMSIHALLWHLCRCQAIQYALWILPVPCRHSRLQLQATLPQEHSRVVTHDHDL